MAKLKLEKFLLTIIISLAGCSGLMSSMPEADKTVASSENKSSLSSLDSERDYAAEALSLALSKYPSVESFKKNPAFYDSLFSTEAKKRILDSPVAPVSGYPSLTLGVEDIISKLRRGQLPVTRDAKLQNISEVNWEGTENGRYYSTQLHSFSTISYLLRDPGITLPNDISKLLSSHVNEWAEYALTGSKINTRTWYEGTTTKRQMALIMILNYFKKNKKFGELSLDKLLYLTHINSTVLLDQEKIYNRGNHGMRQDIALAATALSLPSHPRASEMLNIAHNRLNTMANELFTDSGIWLEHAPGYIDYVLGILRKAKKLAEFSFDFNPKEILENYVTSQNYLLSLINPTGNIPSVGRSPEYLPHIPENTSITEILENLENTVNFDYEYGHAVARGEHPNGLYLLFVASQNLPAGKRHSDDLSFILFNYGQPWITEGGHSSYELTGMTKYQRSAYAHNTYILNDNPMEPRENHKLETSLLDANQSGSKVFLRGITERFHQSGIFERSIEIDNFSTIKIKDRLKAKAKHSSWEGRFNFPKRLQVTISGNTASVKDRKINKLMKIKFTSNADLKLSTCEGQESPICGWGMSSDGFGPVTTLSWTTNEANAEIDIAVKWL